MKFRWWYILLLATPAAVVLWYLNRQGQFAGHFTDWVFWLSLVSLVAFAQLASEVTENLSEFLTPVARGIITASFGNVPELAIGAFLLIQAHNHPNVATTNFIIIRGLLIGSIINNVLFTLGIATFFGAFKHGKLRFDKNRAAGYASMLALAVVGLALPTLATDFAKDVGQAAEENVSLIVAAILIISYIAYVGSEIFHWGDKRASAAVAAASAIGPASAGHHAEHHTHEDHEQHGKQHAEHQPTAEEREEIEAERRKAEREAKAQQRRRENPGILLLSTLAFIVVTALVVGICFILVSVTNTVIVNTALTPLSTGLIIFPVICNIGEMLEAFSKSWGKNKDMEGAMDVAAGSSVQMPLFVTPLLVFFGYGVALLFGGQPLTLIFKQPLELVVVALVTFVYALVNLDGETTWLEGAQLLAFYTMIAVTAFALPGQ
ncbi:MAG: hypothetical protein ABI068_07680 [Ktedonobacterales bacterium]